jgi:hypothetical protein
MKKIDISSVFLLVGLWMLSSCEKEAVNIKLPDQTPKLMISSFISPQDTLTWVMVTNSRPVYGVINYSDDRRVSDATVTLSDGTEEVQLAFYAQQKGYAIDPARFRIQAGKTYTLTVETPDGRRAEASCTVPWEERIINVKIDTVEVQNTYNGVPQPSYMAKQASFQWLDSAGRRDYYRVFGELKREQKNLAGIPYYVIHPWFSGILDEGIDGRTQTQKVVFETYTPGQHFSNVVTLYMYLLHVDEVYYKYHKALGDYDGDNPFAEPVLLYSNIKGGLGVFCSFNRTETVIEVQ